MPSPAAGLSVLFRTVCAAGLGLPLLAAQAPVAFAPVWLGEAGPAGELCARGTTYKVVFDAAGATYFPRLGPKADRHWPLRLSLRQATCGGRALPVAAAPAQRSGPRQVRIERGGLVEVWDFANNHAEQSFVLARWPGPGDLRLDVGCETALDVGTRADGSLTFLNRGGGGVACSDAVVRDAAGSSLRLALGWQGGVMSLCVPAWFLAEASWPVVVDPVVRTVAVASSPTQLARPRAAFDPVAGVWLVVCEDQVTATDTDVLSFRLALDGTVLDSVALDLSAANAIRPDVAAAAGHGSFLAAWIDESSDQLRFRHRLGGSATYGSQHSLALGPQPSDALLALGGSKAGDLSLVCFTTGVGPARQAAVVTIDVNDNVSPLTPVSGTFGSISDLEVADRTGAGEDWGVVLGAGANAEFYGVLAGASPGTILVSPALTVTSAGSSPRVAGFGPFWVTFLDAGSPAAVRVVQVSRFRGHTFVLDFAESLTATENPPPTVTRRSDLALASDGCRFVYSFREDHSTTPTATVLNTVRVRPPGSGILNRCLFDERRAGVGRVGPEPSLCAAGGTGGPAGAYLLLEVDSSSNLSATRYDGRVPGAMFTPVATQCGAPFAPLIGADGLAVLGGSFRVGLARTVGTPLLMVSTPEPTPVAPCTPNPGCRLGVRLPAVLTVPGAAIDLAVPCDGNLLGATLSFQGLDVGGPGGCPANVFGVDLRFTDTLLATVR